MALRFNGLSPTGANPFSAIPSAFVGNTSGAVGSTSNLTTQWGRGERHASKSSFGAPASNPPATESPVAWTLAERGGDLAAENTINQASDLVCNVQRGINLLGAMDAGNATSVSLAMITSMMVEMAQGATLTGPMQMTMSLVADLAQSGNVAAALGLIAWCQTEMEQAGGMEASNLRGTLSLAASIVSYSDFTAEGVRDAVWNALLANFTGDGTAGKTLSMAVSGGVDYEALADAILDDPRFKQLLSTGKFLALK